jgi:hypothetical protein
MGAIIGGAAGALGGAVIGAALFGPLGGAVGAVLGGGLGHLTAVLLFFGHAKEQAKSPITVLCPVYQKPMKVRVDPDRAGWATLIHRNQRVVTCSRWQGKPECDRYCEAGIEI